MFETRFRTIAAAGVAILGILTGRLFYMQVVDGASWRSQARDISVRSILVPGRRGEILDRNGTVLAEDRLGWNLDVRLDRFDGSTWRCTRCGRLVVHVSSKKPPARCPSCGGTRFVPGPKQDLSRLLSLLGVDPGAFRERLRKLRTHEKDEVAARMKRLLKEGGRPRLEDVKRSLASRSWTLVKDVSPAVVKEVSLHPTRDRGLFLVPAYHRFLVSTPEIASIVGITSEPRRTEVKGLEKQGLSYSEILHLEMGRSGLEAKFDSRLRGSDGIRTVEWNHGRMIEISQKRAPKDGQTLRTSIDAHLTEVAARALWKACRTAPAAPDAKVAGAFVALDPHTGEVLAMASVPPRKRDAKKPRASRGGGLNMAIRAVPPGSVFKVVTGIAGLQSGVIDPSATFDCTGVWHRMRCDEPHGVVDFDRALALSCNGYFARAAGRIGVRTLDRYAADLGFGRRTGIELEGEGAGLIGSPDWKKKAYGWQQRQRRRGKKVGFLHTGTWFRANTWQMGFGQGFVLVTPLQAARLMAIVADGGRFVRPTLLDRPNPLGKQVVDPRVLALMRQGLHDVVAYGTAAHGGLSRFGVAGKTGTAQTGSRKRRKRYMAWFAGYAPADDPKVAFACCIEHVDEFGAQAACPVVRRFLQAMLGHRR